MISYDYLSGEKIEAQISLLNLACGRGRLSELYRDPGQ